MADIPPFHLRDRQALGTVTLDGVCFAEGRGDEAYTHASLITPPVGTFQELDTRLRPPFCIAFTLQAEIANTSPFLYFYEDGVPLVPIGGITIDASGLSITIRGESATFTGSYLGSFQQLQLCGDGSSITLYEDCFNAVGTQDFAVAAEGAFTDTDSFSLFATIASNVTFFNVSLITLNYVFLRLHKLDFISSPRENYNNCT